jgi:hypothetical protein
MNRSIRLRIALVAIGVTACGLVDHSESDTQTVVSQALIHGQGFERQGFERQGFERQGTEPGTPALKGFSLRTLAGGRSVVDSARLVEGELVITRSAQVGATLSLSACGVPSNGLGRACGWKAAGIGQCEPGMSVALGDGACGLGSASGDTMLRVCAGLSPCEFGAAELLATNDDACGGLSPRVEFVCPPSGQFAVMVAPYSSEAETSSSPAGEGLLTYPVITNVRRGTELFGARLEAVGLDGSRTAMRIGAVYPEVEFPPPAPGPFGYVGTTYRYEVEELRPDGAWVPLCGPDSDGLPVAIATTGWWDQTASRQEDPDLFTFSCRKGVITKCYRWGYRPWVPEQSPGVMGHSSSEAALQHAKDLHYSCTRMARADYCGDGRSFTVTDTLINIFDDDGVQLRSDAPPDFFFEAGWVTTGATCLNHKRWDFAPDSVKYENCPNLYDVNQLPDGTIELIPRMCDSAGEARAKNPVTSLFNESQTHFWGEPR